MMEQKVDKWMNKQGLEEEIADTDVFNLVSIGFARPQINLYTRSFSFTSFNLDNNLLHPEAMTRDTAPFSPSSTLSGTLIQHSSSVHGENKEVALSSMSGPVTDE